MRLDDLINNLLFLRTEYGGDIAVYAVDIDQAGEDMLEATKIGDLTIGMGGSSSDPNIKCLIIGSKETIRELSFESDTKLDQ